MSDKIILLGFMGCGKSTIGKSVAKQLGYDFIDLDDEIEKTAKTTISKIFESKGEKYFRQLESQVLKDTLASNNKMVLALGGGTPCYNNNLKLIRKRPSFYIRCGVDILVKRLKKEKAHRPIIASQRISELKGFISSKLKERTKYYEQASFTIVGSRSISKVTDRLIQLAKKM